MRAVIPAGQSGETFVARVTAEEPIARRISDLLADLLDPDYSAVSVFETTAGWTAEAVFRRDHDRVLIRQIVERFGVSGPLTFSTVAERDWVAASLEGLAPVSAGRFVLHGSHDRARVRANQIGIEIEAALAFGTGHHGTTRGCLLAFDTIRKRTSSTRAWRVLDIGTGTGVLAIAAARALHITVQASDIDPMAVAVSRDNARLNRVAARVTPFVASGAGAHRLKRAGPYDVIFANILEGPLRRMSAPAARLLAPAGHIILSGLLPGHANGVIAAYRRQGLALESRLTLEGWVTLSMRRGQR